MYPVAIPSSNDSVAPSLTATVAPSLILLAISLNIPELVNSGLGIPPINNLSADIPPTAKAAIVAIAATLPEFIATPKAYSFASSCLVLKKVVLATPLSSSISASLLAILVKVA